MKDGKMILIAYHLVESSTDGKMWIFGFSLRVCLTEQCNLVSSLEYLVSNGRQVLLGDIRFGSSATCKGC